MFGRLKFRLHTPVDVDDIVRIRDACFGECPLGHDYNVMSAHRIHVALDRGSIVGFVSSSSIGRSQWIEAIAIDPLRQREGLGSRMVDFVFDAMDYQYRDGVTTKHLFAAVAETDLTAQLFFRSIGFTAVRTSKRHFPNQDGYIFRRSDLIASNQTTRVNHAA